LSCAGFWTHQVAGRGFLISILALSLSTRRTALPEIALLTFWDFWMVLSFWVNSAVGRGFFIFNWKIILNFPSCEIFGTNYCFMRILFLGFLLFGLAPSPLFAQGYLVAVGGGSESDASGSWSEESYRYIADHTTNDTLVVLSESSESDWIPTYFQSFGVSVVHNLQISNHSVEEITNKLKTATSVFIKGGDQRDYIREWNETSVVNEINRIYEEGGVISGTSAGAMSLSEFVSTGGPKSYENLEDPQNRFNEIVSPFLSLRQRLVFDTHYFERGRMGRLLGIYSNLYQAGETDIIGIGVDDKTAVIIDPEGIMRVAGSGGVQVFWADDEFEMFSEMYEPLHLRRLAMHQLVDGYEIDLESMEIITEPDRAELVDIPESDTGFTVNLDLQPNLSSDETIQNLHDTDGEQASWVVISESTTDPFSTIHAETEFVQLSAISSDDDLRAQLSSADRILFDLNADDFQKLLKDFSESATFIREESASESILLTIDSDLANLLSASYVSNLTSDDAASYYGDFSTQPGINLLSDGVVLDDTFTEDDFQENRVTSLPWLIHKNELDWGIWATGLKELQLQGDSVRVISDWSRSGSRSTPSVIIDLSDDGYSTAQSPFYFNSNRNKRNSVALTNARISVIPSGVWGFPFEENPTVGIEQNHGLNAPQQPSGFQIRKIYPNPFNPTTTIQANFLTSGSVSVGVFSILGERVMEINERISAGAHSFELNLSARPSGVYLVKVGFEGTQVLEKVTLIK